ncbi:winged helix-turn-helix transcriptional regulator [Streptomyces violaceusniger]|uniref:winged helix-turn-helix transcriptional regulator n=1 Tax=Streptomyces violaceusniger TaxID=68280 RepID=UPI000B07EA37
MVPPKVEYSLTELGDELNTALGPLGAWGKRRMAVLEEAGLSYGAAAPPGAAAAPGNRRQPAPSHVFSNWASAG